MIKSFRCKETEKIFNRTFSRKLPQEMQRAAYKKLLMLDAAVELVDLTIPPSNKLEALKGERLGQHSIRINKQYRICFVWKNGIVTDAEIVDYH